MANILIMLRIQNLFYKHSGSTYILTSKQNIGPIGKMPGSISIDMGVNIMKGNIKNEKLKGKNSKINILGGVNITINVKRLDGTLKDGKLHFVLDTYAGWEAISLFPASVTFDGVE